MLRYALLTVLSATMAGSAAAEEAPKSLLDELFAGNERLIAGIPSFEARFTVAGEYGDFGRELLNSGSNSLEDRFRDELSRARYISKVYFRADGEKFILDQAVSFYSEDDEPLRQNQLRAAFDGQTLRVARESETSPFPVYHEYEVPQDPAALAEFERTIRDTVTFDLRNYWGKDGERSLRETVAANPPDLEWEVTASEDEAYTVVGSREGRPVLMLAIDGRHGFMITEAKTFSAHADEANLRFQVVPSETEGMWFPGSIAVHQSVLTQHAEVESLVPNTAPITPAETTWESMGISVCEGMYLRHQADGTKITSIPEKGWPEMLAR